MLEQFVIRPEAQQRAQTNNENRLAMLFTEYVVYEDGFFGSHAGRRSPLCGSASTIPEPITSGSLSDPVSDGNVGYARFRCS